MPRLRANGDLKQQQPPWSGGLGVVAAILQVLEEPLWFVVGSLKVQSAKRLISRILVPNYKT